MIPTPAGSGAAQPIPDGVYWGPDAPSEEAYRSDTAVAISDLKEINISPAHYYSKKYGGQRTAQTPAQVIGVLTHLAVLEPEKFAETVVAEPEDAPRRPTKAQLDAKKPSPATLEAIAYWDAFDAGAIGKTILPADEIQRLQDMRASVMACPYAVELLRDSRKEVAVFNTRKVVGYTMRLKGRIDIIPPGDLLGDLKTVDRGYANPEDFGGSIAKWRYHQQAAWYIDLVNEMEGQDPFGPSRSKRRWQFIVLEKEPPYACAVMELDADSIDIGRRQNARALSRLAYCLSTNEWEGPGDGGVLSVGLPNWGRQ